MPRTVLAVTEVTREGAAVQAFVACDAANGMEIAANTGDLELELVNSGASDKTMTVAANPDLQTDGLTVSDLPLVVPYGFTYKFGPFKPNSFRQDTSGKMHLDFSSGSDFTIRATKRESNP